MLTSLFWFDATLTLFRRWRNKETLSVAHRKHVYQRAVQSGLSHQSVLLFSPSDKHGYYVVGIFCTKI